MAKRMGIQQLRSLKEYRMSYNSVFSTFFQEQVTSAVALAIEQQMQKVLEETQLDMNEFDNLLQPIIDTCTKDAISVSVLNLNSYLVGLWIKYSLNFEIVQ